MKHFESVIIGLQEEIPILKLENRSLIESNKALCEENSKLKDQLALTSKNSSIPTSKELYKHKLKMI